MLLAVDRFLDLPEPPTAAEVLLAAEGHILDQAALTGTYTRHG
jgi:phosphatidylethanolamine-binding protein (PEBP) family uncharacterized protein